jgi:hypothetical protein
MAKPKSEYLERLVIINYLEIQQMKKAIYTKLGIEDDSHKLFADIDEELNKLLEQKNVILMKALEEWYAEREPKRRS